MYSVTQRIKKIKQPRGGYLPVSKFEKTMLQLENQLIDGENVHASLIGLAVDYLTRFMLGNSAQDAFTISLLGAKLCRDEKYAHNLIKQVQSIDDTSIISAIRLSGYDVCYRAGMMGYRPVQEIEPNDATISNIREMVQRSLEFFKMYGPVTLDGFTFEGGYTDIVSSGDGDFLTQDTLWDFKVSVNPPNKDHTLQLLVYYLMGKSSIHKEFDGIKNLAIFNPRLNIVYLFTINHIDSETINTVMTDVIGY